MGKRKTESIYAHKVPMEEIKTAIEPLKNKEPTPAWRAQFKELLKRYDVQLSFLKKLTANSKKTNLLMRRYTESNLTSAIQDYRRKHHGWTENNAKTVNDHLDILAEYLMKPEEDVVELNSSSEEKPILTLKERLEKELEEGKWPRVEEKRRTTEEMVELLRKDTPPTAVYIKAEKLTANDIREEAGLEPIEDPRPETTKTLGDRLRENFLKTAQRLESFVDVPEKAPSKVKLRKTHKRRTHKTHTITININLGR